MTRAHLWSPSLIDTRRSERVSDRCRARSGKLWSEGSLGVPNPNIFGGPVLVRRAGAEEWSEVPLTHSADVMRGIGVADMAYALSCGRPHRANGEMGYHVLDVMHAFDEASKSGKHVVIQSGCDRPAPLPTGLLPGTLDE